MKKIIVLNGPNINMLGIREKKVYGAMDYKTLCKNLAAEAEKIKVGLEIFQSNAEGELVDKIQSLHGKADCIIINPGAYTHTSIAIRDALASVDAPFIELHISNVFAREDFRKKSFVSAIASGIVAGFGTEGYFIALRAAAGLAGKSK